MDVCFFDPARHALFNLVKGKHLTMYVYIYIYMFILYTYMFFFFFIGTLARHVSGTELEVVVMVPRLQRD